MKSKELQALEEIKNHKIKLDVDIKYDNGDETQCRFETIKDMFPKQFAIIETALKEYEELYERHLKSLGELDQWKSSWHLQKYELEQNDEKLKAFEIIKEHKLLNYVLKNEKCSNMYHLSKEEKDLLRSYCYD